MKTIKNYKEDENGKACNVNSRWRLVASLVPVASIVLLLMSAFIFLEKKKMSHHLNSDYRPGDIGWRVAMPVLNAALK